MEATERTFSEKIGDLFFKLKTYWKKPPKGYYVTYKEFVNLSLGYGGLSFLSVMIQWTTLATSVHMMISYFKVNTGLVWVLSLIGSLIALVRSPILSMIIDNNNSKRGKFKPFLMWSCAAAAVCFCCIPFIPNAWNAINLFSFEMPAIPIFGIAEASTLSVSVAVLVMFVLLQIGAFFQTLFSQCLCGVEQTISTVAQERANIGAIRGLICNIPSSLVNVVLPILAGSLFAKLGGWNSIEMYRWAFPFCAIGAVALTFFTVKGTKERVVVNQRYRAKVKFFDGAKELSKNKYFWIITIMNIAAGIRNYCNLTTWITQYSFQSDLAVTIVGLYCSTLLMNILILGMVLGPILIKKFGKRKIMVVTSIGYAVMILFQFLVHKSPVLILVAAFLQNIFNGFFYINGIMVSDALDFQQWKTGKRLEGFWQNYASFITTFVAIFTSMLLPLFLSFAGVSFSDDISVALQDTAKRNDIFKYQTLLALIGAVITMVPVLFYDLTEKKHADIIRVLKLRAAVDNLNDGMLQDEDVLNVSEILDYAKENDNQFVNDELEKFDCIGDILANYEDVKRRTDDAAAAEEQAEFERNLDLEKQKLEARRAHAAEKAAKKGEAFDAEEFTASFVKRSRFMSQLDENGERRKTETEQEIREELKEETVREDAETVWGDNAEQNKTDGETVSADVESETEEAAQETDGAADDSDNGAE